MAANTRTPILDSNMPPRHKAWRTRTTQVALLRSWLILCMALMYVFTAHVKEQKEAMAEAPVQTGKHHTYININTVLCVKYINIELKIIEL